MKRPLTGLRVLVTRSPDQAAAMCRALEDLGAIAIRFPAIDFAPLPTSQLDTALTRLAEYHWLAFTSGNAVRFFFDCLARRTQAAAAKLPALLAGYGVKVAAVGSATRAELVRRGFGIDFMPEEFTGEQLALGLGDVAEQKILLPRAQSGRPDIVALLRERGAIVDDIPLYVTVTVVPSPEALAEAAQGVDVITFTSPSSVRNLRLILDRQLTPSLNAAITGAHIACIGPSTAQEAARAGYVVTIQPQEYTIDALIGAIVDFFAREHSSE